MDLKIRERWDADSSAARRKRKQRGLRALGAVGADPFVAGQPRRSHLRANGSKHGATARLIGWEGERDWKGKAFLVRTSDDAWVLQTVGHLRGPSPAQPRSQSGDDVARNVKTSALSIALLGLPVSVSGLRRPIVTEGVSPLSIAFRALLYWLSTQLCPRG